jgi:hypothetical protein
VEYPVFSAPGGNCSTCDKGNLTNLINGSMVLGVLAKEKDEEQNDFFKKVSFLTSP